MITVAQIALRTGRSRRTIHNAIGRLIARGVPIQQVSTIYVLTESQAEAVIAEMYDHRGKPRRRVEA